MLREFANRDELMAYLRQEFPDVAEGDDQISEKDFIFQYGSVKDNRRLGGTK